MEDSIQSLVENTPKYPQWIQESLDKEKEVLKHINHKIARKVNDTLLLKEETPKEARGQLKRLPCIVTKIAIYQKKW